MFIIERMSRDIGAFYEHIYIKLIGSFFIPFIFDIRVIYSSFTHPMYE